MLALTLTACTARGGGQLPPDTGFTGPASFGFQFSCQDNGGLNPPTGQLRIELSYTDHGTSLIGSGFSIHGIVDTLDPVLESEFCIGKNPPPGGNELIFLGRYYLTSSAPDGFPSTCPARATATAPLCRFEVMVRDNDRNRRAVEGRLLPDHPVERDSPDDRIRSGEPCSTPGAGFSRVEISRSIRQHRRSAAGRRM